jgi:hypothetical protein
MHILEKLVDKPVLAVYKSSMIFHGALRAVDDSHVLISPSIIINPLLRDYDIDSVPRNLYLHTIRPEYQAEENYLLLAQTQLVPFKFRLGRKPMTERGFDRIHPGGFGWEAYKLYSANFQILSELYESIKRPHKG